MRDHHFIPPGTEEECLYQLMAIKWDEMLDRNPNERMPQRAGCAGWVEKTVLAIKHAGNLPDDAIKRSNQKFFITLNNSTIVVKKDNELSGIAFPKIGYYTPGCLSGLLPEDAAAFILDFDSKVPEMAPAAQENYRKIQRERFEKEKKQIQLRILNTLIESAFNEYLRPNGINLKWDENLGDNSVVLRFSMNFKACLSVSTEELPAILSDPKRIMGLLQPEPMPELRPSPDVACLLREF